MAGGAAQYHVGGLQMVVRSFLNANPFILYERFDARRVLADAARRGATHISVVDKMLQDMLAAPNADQLRRCVHPAGRGPAERADARQRPGRPRPRVRQLRHDRRRPATSRTPWCCRFHGRHAAASRLRGAHRGRRPRRVRPPARARPRVVLRLFERRGPLTRPTGSSSPATPPPSRPTASCTSRSAPTTCSSRAGRTSIPPRSAKLRARADAMRDLVKWEAAQRGRCGVKSIFSGARARPHRSRSASFAHRSGAHAPPSASSADAPAQASLRLRQHRRRCVSTAYSHGIGKVDHISSALRARHL